MEHLEQQKTDSCKVHTTDHIRNFPYFEKFFFSVQRANVSIWCDYATGNYETSYFDAMQRIEEKPM